MVVRRSALMMVASLTSLLLVMPVQGKTDVPPEESASTQEAVEVQSANSDAAVADSSVSESDVGTSPEAVEIPADAASQESVDQQELVDTVSTDAPTASSDNLETIPVVPIVQEDPLATRPMESTAETTQLDEIMVTATKRNQSVRDIPSTINVMTGEKLESQGARELQDFVDQVPGLQMQDVAVTGSRKIVIRGIAPDNTTNQTVGVVFGDVPLGDPIGSYTVVDPDTWDLETVEVLKGPQGTLFGASSLAGIIRYVPRAPQLMTWEGKAFAEWMSTKDGGAAPTYGVAVNAPIGSELAFRMSGSIEKKPGVIDINNPSRMEEDADESRKWSGRAMALWEPNEQLRINALYMSQSRRSGEPFFVTNFDADYTRYDAPESSSTSRTFDLASIDARYRFDWATLVSLTAYQNKENRFNFDTSYALASQLGEAGVEAGRTRRDVESRGLMQEFRLVSPDGGDWSWQAGIFYSDFNASVASDIYLTAAEIAQPLLNLVPQQLRDSFATENGISLGNATTEPLIAEESALFGEVTRDFGSVNLTVGGRLYRTSVSGVNANAGLLPFITTRQTRTVEDLDVSSRGFSPKVALSWDASDDILVYGGVSRGFQYGGVNAVAIPSPNSTAPKTYDSSSLWTFEAGVRTDWLDRTLRADMTAYFQKWSNAQVSQIAPPAEAYIDNVGEVEVKGIELSFRYLLPIEGLSLETNGSFLSSKTSAEFTDSDGNIVPVGTEMPNAPRVQAAATIGYAKTFAENWETSTALLYTYTDRSWGNIEHTGILDERNMLNFNFRIARSDLRFAPSLSLVVNNLTDQRKIVSATETAATESDPSRALENFPVGYTRPRTVIIRLGAEFR